MRWPRVEPGDPVEVVLVELEVEDVEVAAEPLRRRRLGDRCGTDLGVPPEHHLSRRLAVPVADLGEHGVVEQVGAAADRRPALRDDVVALVGGTLLDLREVGVQLDLVDGGRHAGLRDEAGEVLGEEVGDADRRRQSFVAELDHGLPGLDVLVDAGQRPVDQEEVDVIEPEPLEGGGQLDARTLRAVGVAGQLGRDEQLVARHRRVGDAAADLGLVLVAGGRVEQAVAGVDRLDEDLRVLDRVRPEAEDRHLASVVELQQRCGVHASKRYVGPQPTCLAAARPAARPLKMQPPRNVPSSEL